MKIRRLLGKLLVAIVSMLAIVECVVIINLTKINSKQHQRQLIRAELTNDGLVQDNLQKLHREAISRAALYDELIQKEMLVDGMVIHRGAKGQIEGLCDSLLFSSLRFYALSKLGFQKSADAAWQSILGSRKGAQWYRHPQCSKSLSRDMVMGVLVALSANPKGGDEVFRSMLAEIDRNWGFAGDGPFYVSWLSPGIAGLLRFEAEKRHVPFEEWPWNLKHSFSSIEYDAMFLDEGYVSHLAALGLWLEIEQAKQSRQFNPRSLFGLLQRKINESTKKDTSIDEQRRQWIAGRLRSIHGSNIFYELLEFKTYGDLTPVAERYLLNELLSMRQFPISRLPQDCDRDADYLWQRREGEAVSTVKKCGETWNGVDFLFAAALLGAGNGVSQSPDQNTEFGLPVAH